MATSEKRSKERTPFWRFMGLAVAIGAVALSANLLGHSLHRFGNIKK
jgi:anti-sigma-K factor RskA